MTIRAETESFQHATPVTFGAAPARSLIVRMAKNVAAYWQSRRNRRSVAVLLEFDDRMLKDIGVTRYDVTSALASPARQDPSQRLASLSEERRLAQLSRQHFLPRLKQLGRTFG